MSDSNKILKGIYKIELRWDLIWLYNVETKVEETIKRDMLHTLMMQSFNIDTIERFTERLYNGDKFIVDFDKEKIKIIKSKEVPFESVMNQYFNANYIQQEIDNGIDLTNIYKKDGNAWQE